MASPALSPCRSEDTTEDGWWVYFKPAKPDHLQSKKGCPTPPRPKRLRPECVRKLRKGDGDLEKALTELTRSLAAALESRDSAIAERDAARAALRRFKANGHAPKPWEARAGIFESAVAPANAFFLSPLRSVAERPPAPRGRRS